jgi:hypothetical protein
MKAWIQSADFSQRDLDVDAEGAIRTLSSHDWSAETAMAKRLEGEGREFCQPGLGLVREDGHLLHVCPEGASASVHWQRPVSGLRQFLTKRHRAQETETWEDVPLSRLPAAIRNFYNEEPIDLHVS